MQLAETATWQGDRLNWKVFRTEDHPSMTLHTEKADSDFVYSHETPWLCPTFISRAEKTAFKCRFGLLKKLHLAVMKQSARVCTDASVRGRKCVGVLVCMHTLAACMFVHLLKYIKAIKALLLDSSSKLPLK